MFEIFGGEKKKSLIYHIFQLVSDKFTLGGLGASDIKCIFTQSAHVHSHKYIIFCEGQGMWCSDTHSSEMFQKMRTNTLCM